MPSTPSVPNYSKNKIKKAGQVLVNPKAFSDEEKQEAQEILSQWRACHAYPLNTFQATLRDKVRRGYKDPIVAQRLKRLPTIVDKLKRYPNMKLTTMQDIGGVRVVLKTVDDVYRLVEKYKNGKKFKHTLADQHDYIQEPRGEDGYRSVHLVYRYQNSYPGAEQYNGLKVEMQLRTRLQHSWATAVETMGTMLGQALKSRQGEQEWLNFFALVSAAFAHIEKTPLVPNYEHLSKEQTFRAVAKAETELQVLEKMQSYASALRQIGIQEDRTKWSYHLITLNTMDSFIEIKSYGRGELKKATDDYSAAEKDAISNPKLDSVLVSAGPLEELQKAYPNYFLNVSEFAMHVRRIIKVSES